MVLLNDITYQIEAMIFNATTGNGNIQIKQVLRMNNECKANKQKPWQRLGEKQVKSGLMANEPTNIIGCYWESMKNIIYKTLLQREEEGSVMYDVRLGNKTIVSIIVSVSSCHRVIVIGIAIISNRLHKNWSSYRKNVEEISLFIVIDGTLW